ncbi:MAG: prolyl oligopeptidase family serine peptidase [Planctomycetota bacterium]
MRTPTLACFGLIALSVAWSGCSQTFPEARRSDHTDEYHGTTVADPYRWLEETDSAETQLWIAAQNSRTRAYLDGIPERAAIEQRLTELWDYAKFGMPQRHGERIFFKRNDGLQPQAPLYVQEGLAGEPRILLDPNTLSEDGTVAVRNFWVSPDGALICYGLSAGGSDWMEWKIRDVATGKDLDDHLKWIKFSGAGWLPDGSGFYYGRYDAPKEGESLKGVNYFQKVYFHKVGTPQSDDVLVYERPDEKEWGFGVWPSEDGRYLLNSVWKGTARQNLFFYKRLDDPAAEWVELISEWSASYGFLGNVGSRFYFRTTDGAPRYRVVAIDVAGDDRTPQEVVPESAETLQSASIIGGTLLCSYLKDAHAQVRTFALDGTPAGAVALPGIGSAGGFGGYQRDGDTFYSYTSFDTPNTIYHYDVASGKSTIFKQAKVDVDPSRFESKQVFFTSKDGTKVPMFIVHKKGLTLDGNNPVYLYGYGGFNNSMTPWFSVSNVVWMERGGVYAMPNIRGGGEYGRDWHQAAVKTKKQNCFDDFIAAAEWLIAEGYTKPERLAIGGGSNGGLLVGACMTQRPELFGACLPAVGVLDMLRFESFTIGWAWTSDYGSVKNAAEFEALLAYSPYHNCTPGTAYPPTDHDDRVFPAHSFKFAAALQHAHAGDAPILIRITTKAGHGAGKPTKMRIAETADRWAFLVDVLDAR